MKWINFIKIFSKKNLFKFFQKKNFFNFKYCCRNLFSNVQTQTLARISRLCLTLEQTTLIIFWSEAISAEKKGKFIQRVGKVDQYQWRTSNKWWDFYACKDVIIFDGIIRKWRIENEELRQTRDNSEKWFWVNLIRSAGVSLLLVIYSVRLRTERMKQWTTEWLRVMMVWIYSDVSKRESQKEVREKRGKRENFRNREMTSEQ